METPDYNLHDDFAGRGDPYRVAYLIAAFIQGTILENEHDELDDWVAASDDNMAWKLCILLLKRRSNSG